MTTAEIELSTIKTGGEVVPGPSIPPTPSTRSDAQSISSRRGRNDSPELGDTAGSTTLALPPVDGGIDAWRFLVAATVLETTVWGE